MKERIRVLIADPVDAQCAGIFRAAGFDVTIRTGMSGRELRTAIALAEVLIVRSQTQIGRAHV